MEPTTKPQNYFEKLSKINVSSETFKVGMRELRYVNWAEAWYALKREYPCAGYKVFETAEGLPYYGNESVGYFCKVSVYVPTEMDGGRTVAHEVILPILDSSNRAMKLKEQKWKDKYGKDIVVEPIDAANINKTIMRALVKAIAMHGLGLFVYQGEDKPEE